MDLSSDVITRLAKIEMALNRIADALTAQALPDEPNFTRDLSAYPGFDWGTGGGVDPVAFELPHAALPAPAQRQAIPAAVDNHAQAMPPRATVNQVAPPPTEQPALFLWEMRRTLQADDAEIKRRLKALGVKGFPAAHDAAGYATLKARLTQAQAVR